MKIMVVARGYPTGRYRMNGLFEYDQAIALVNAGHQVALCFVDLRSAAKVRAWGFEQRQQDGLTIMGIHIPCGRIPARVLHRINVWGLRQVYNRIVSTWGRPDLIHGHFIRMGAAMAEALEDTGIPLVLTEHFSGMHETELSPDLFRLGHATYPRIDGLITVSQHLADLTEARFGIKPMVIPNVIQDHWFAQAAYIRQEKPFIYVSTGALTTAKGMDVLVDACVAAFQRQPDMQLHLFGDGPLRSALAHTIQQHGLDARILLRGSCSREVIAHQMGESHAFVLLSRKETFGVAVAEALAAGLPVLSTRSGGPEEFIHPGNGILLSDPSVAAVTAHLLAMPDQIHQYPRVDIAREIQDQFSGQVVADRLTAYYEIVRNESGRSR